MFETTISRGAYQCFEEKKPLNVKILMFCKILYYFVYVTTEKDVVLTNLTKGCNTWFVLSETKKNVDLLFNADGSHMQVQ